MLQASSPEMFPAAVHHFASAGRLWPFPPGLAADFAADQQQPLSSRAQAIARSRDEMLSLLRDLPESEYELSLTDLVEKSDSAAPNAGASGGGGEEADSEEKLGGRSKRRRPRRSDGGSCSSGGGGNFRSSSDGVLLNMYMPRLLSRSMTSPQRSSRGANRAGGRVTSMEGDAGNRSNPRVTNCTVGCWPALWHLRWPGKSKTNLKAAHFGG